MVENRSISVSLCLGVIFNEAAGCFALETCPCIIRAQKRLRNEPPAMVNPSTEAA